MKDQTRASIFTIEQERELALLKQYRPFRIVWGAVNVQTEPHTFEAHADYTRHRLNSYLRKGWLVATVDYAEQPKCQRCEEGPQSVGALCDTCFKETVD